MNVFLIAFNSVRGNMVLGHRVRSIISHYCLNFKISINTGERTLKKILSLR